jgi:hypothetical protein
LSIDTIVDDVHCLKSLLLRIVNGDSALQSSGLERQRCHEVRVVSIVVCINPSLGAGLAIWRDNKDNILGPE